MAPAAFLSLVQSAEARTAAKDWKAAGELWQQVVKSNPVEGRFWDRLATARFGAKDYPAAIAAYRKAIELGFGAPENNAYNIACAYALSGDKDQAFAWLDRAFSMGFLNLELARTDEDLAALRGDPRFQQLLPFLDTSGMSREEGWRHDLRFLGWQIDRLGAAPYRRKPKPWFEQEFATLAASTPSRTDTQMALQLTKIMRELGDGHSGVRGRADADWALTLPLQFAAFEDGVYIVAAAPQHRGLLGAQVLQFGGHPVEEIMAAVAETVSRDNEGPWVRLQSSYRLRHVGLLNERGVIPERTAASLRVRDIDGKERAVRVAADASHPDIWNMNPIPRTG